VHFDWNVSLGSLIIAGTVVGMGWRVLAVARNLDRVLFEHDILWQRYLKEHPEMGRRQNPR